MDIMPNSQLEDYAAYLAEVFPKSVLGKFMHMSISESDQARGAQSNPQKDIRVREHVFDFELRFPLQRE
jgi:hypothetical protein